MNVETDKKNPVEIIGENVSVEDFCMEINGEQDDYLISSIREKVTSSLTFIFNGIEKDNGTNKEFLKIIIKPKEMSLKDIEKELGYPIILKEEEI